MNATGGSVCLRTEKRVRLIQIKAMQSTGCAQTASHDLPHGQAKLRSIHTSVVEKAYANIQSSTQQNMEMP